MAHSTRNSIKFILKKAKLSYGIFLKLIEQHISDVLHVDSPAEFSALNAIEIAEIFGKEGIIIFDIENQIRKPVSRLRNIIKSKLNICPDAVIKTVRRQETGDKYFG